MPGHDDHGAIRLFHHPLDRVLGKEIPPLRRILPQHDEIKTAAFLDDLLPRKAFLDNGSRFDSPAGQDTGQPDHLGTTLRPQPPHQGLRRAGPVGGFWRIHINNVEKRHTGRTLACEAGCMLDRPRRAGREIGRHQNPLSSRDQCWERFGAGS